MVWFSLKDSQEWSTEISGCFLDLLPMSQELFKHNWHRSVYPRWTGLKQTRRKTGKLVKRNYEILSLGSQRRARLEKYDFTLLSYFSFQSHSVYPGRDPSTLKNSVNMLIFQDPRNLARCPFLRKVPPRGAHLKTSPSKGLWHMAYFSCPFGCSW